MSKFLSSRDFEFFQHVNREISSDIIDSLVILYKLNLDHTNVNIYGESPNKVMNEGVELPAIIEYNKTETQNDVGFGVNKIQEASFRFVRRILQERHVYPEIGDIILYNNSYYEIDNVNDIQLLASRPENKHSIICSSHLTRRRDFQIEPRNV